MRVLMMGDSMRADTVHMALSAAHLKRPIAVILYTGRTVVSLAAEQWANQNGVLCGDVWDGAESPCIFDLADAIIAFPGTSHDFLAMARERGAKVWQPFKVSGYDGR